MSREEASRSSTPIGLWALDHAGTGFSVARVRAGQGKPRSLTTQETPASRWGVCYGGRRRRWPENGLLRSADRARR